MKSRVFSFLLIVFSCLFFAAGILAVSYPSPSGFVNDFAGIYSAGFKENLESKLSEFEKQTGTETAVVTVKTLEGEAVEEYAVRLFEKWRIGKKDEDNGLLLLIVKDDREVRIEVGYGLEPFITDGRAGEIIRNDIVPSFRQEKYDEGTDRAIGSLMKYISDKDVAPAGGITTDSEVPFTAIIFGIFFFITYMSSFLGRTKAIWPGGAIGAILGLVLGAIFFSYAAGIFLAVIAGFFGLFMDFLLSRNYKIRKDKGLPTSFWSSGGGFRSGGGSSFGGFGGGGSGGGGASGRW